MIRASAAAATTAKIIDGKKIAETIRGEIAAEVAALKAKTGKVPTRAHTAQPCMLHPLTHDEVYRGASAQLQQNARG